MGGLTLMSKQVHVQRLINDIDTHGEISYKALQNVQASQPFDGNILYALAHEAIYCQGYNHTPCTHLPRFPH